MITREEYDVFTSSTRQKRLEWFKDARFGMFIHYGLYSVSGMGEWEMYTQNMDIEDYEKLAKHFKPAENCTDLWCQTAKNAGAKYVVMTTRHHDGFSLWNSKTNPYNLYNYTGRDLVKEFVESCRKYGLKIGLYSSLMDWHHPDGWKCATDEEARLRFTKYIEDLNVELLSNYGKIDILWYDMSFPLKTSTLWDSVNRNYKLRQLQPDLLINNRSKMPEDFFTPEESNDPKPDDPGGYFEACMTFNKISWGYINEEQAKKFNYSSQQIARMLTICTKKGGNFLLNIGPRPDGTLPEDDKNEIERVGKWLENNGSSIYGDSIRNPGIQACGNCVTIGSSTADGKSAYLYNLIWPSNGEIVIGGYINPPSKITCVSDGREIKFRKENHRFVMYDLPSKPIDDVLGITVFKLEFDEPIKCCPASHYPHMRDGIPYQD